MSKLSAFIERVKRLKGPIAAIAAGGAILGGLAGYWNAYHAARQAVRDPIESSGSSKATIPADAGPLSILVLPFANQTGDTNKTYIADALTSSISADLNRIRDAFVVPTATAFTYKDKNLTVAQMRKDAGVRFVLQGGVVASGDKLRINVQLADTLSGKQLWNETIEGDASNIFELQDLVTARIGNSIGDQLVIVAARESEKRKTSPKVADLMMRQRALALKPQSIEIFNQREALLRDVIQQDPDNAEAFADLAKALALYAGNFLDEGSPKFQTLLKEAKALALLAKAMDDQLPGIYIALAIHSDLIDRDGAETQRNLAMAIKVAPKSPGVYTTLSHWYMKNGQAESAVELLKRALALYPKGSDTIFGNLAGAYLMLGENLAAIEWGQRGIDIGSTFPSAFSDLAMAYANLGQMEEARRNVNKYKQRMTQLGLKQTIPKLDGTEGPAYVKYYEGRLLPEWRKAGLPE